MLTYISLAFVCAFTTFALSAPVQALNAQFFQPSLSAFQTPPHLS